jgi:hypothetical protein
MSTSNLALQVALKLRLIHKRHFRHSRASAALKEPSEVGNSIHGLPPELCSQHEKGFRPSHISVASERSPNSQVLGRMSLSKLSLEDENDPRQSDASTASKQSSGTEQPTASSLSKALRKLQNSRSKAECPRKSPLKRPVIRPHIYPGPSNLAGRCNTSMVPPIPAQGLDTLSKYWYFRNKFDRLARRGYRRGEEIECLLRCSKSPLRPCGLNTGLVGAHSALYNELDRLQSCLKKQEANLDEEMARVVLDETEMFMKGLECLTGDLQYACLSLQSIFDEAIASEVGLEFRMQNPNTVFPEVWECRFTWMCKDLLREARRLTYAISSKGRKGKANAAGAVAGDLMQEQDQVCRDTANRSSADLSGSSRGQVVKVDSVWMDRTEVL